MKTNCVVQNGVVIHVGEWEHYRQEVIDDEMCMVDNPIPEDAIQGEFDIEITAGGRFVLSSDYRALRASEYPSIGDQLDALFKAGAFTAEMSAQIKAVKDRFPKVV